MAQDTGGGGVGAPCPVARAVSRRRAGVLGPQAGAVDADGTMWAFSEAHPLP